MLAPWSVAMNTPNLSQNQRVRKPSRTSFGKFEEASVAPAVRNGFRAWAPSVLTRVRSLSAAADPAPSRSRFRPLAPSSSDPPSLNGRVTMHGFSLAQLAHALAHTE